MESTYDLEAGLNAIEAELNKADSVITVIQQHYFNVVKEHVARDPFILLYEYNRYSDLLDVGLELVQSAKEALAALRQNVEGGMTNG